MDTTELANRWQRDGYDVATRQVMPDISRSPHVHPFDARGLILAGELTLTWEGQTHLSGWRDLRHTGRLHT